MRAKLASLAWIVAVAALAPSAASGAATQPIATASTNWSGVELDLVSVERKGGVLTVKWAVRNGGSTKSGVGFGYSGGNARTYVVDEESGTKYFVLTDKEGQSLASQHVYVDTNQYGVSEQVPPGETRRYWMKLPAPPPAVKTVTILFNEAEPFEEVPITDK